MESHIRVLDRLVAKERDGHFVGTTDTHTIDRVITVDVGDSGILGARRRVDSHNSGSSQRLTVIILDVSGEAGSCDLSEGHHSHKDSHKSGKSSFK